MAPRPFRRRSRFPLAAAPAVAAITAALLLPGCGDGTPPATGSGAGGPRKAPAGPPDGMVRIPGGRFRMGTNSSPYPFEGPVHEVTVSPFYMDRYEVTNREFAAFVAATGYVTVAEKWGWSIVFNERYRPTGRETPHEIDWWDKVDRANWRHPKGPRSSIKGKDRYPVVQVTWDDAVAYCKWAEKRLPTEAEWELAARGGMPDQTYFWGNDLQPAGKFMANYWQGQFPGKDRGDDGCVGIAEGGRFPPNGYGLYDMAANVWEWTHDFYDPDYYRKSPAENPRGPEQEQLEESGDPRQPPQGAGHSIRGGSFLCSVGFCQGYRVAARNKEATDSSANHLGFRCVKDLGR